MFVLPFYNKRMYNMYRYRHSNFPNERSVVVPGTVSEHLNGWLSGLDRQDRYDDGADGARRGKFFII